MLKFAADSSTFDELLVSDDAGSHHPFVLLEEKYLNSCRPLVASPKKRCWRDVFLSPATNCKVWQRAEFLVDEHDNQLRQEVFDVYKQLRRMCGDVRRVCSRGEVSGTVVEEMVSSEGEETESQQGTLVRGGGGGGHYKVGTLTGVMKELQGIMTELVKCELCLCKPERCSEMEAQLKHMSDEVCNTRNHLERIKYQMELRDEEIRKKSDELSKLTEKLSVQQEQMSQLTSERDQIIDEASGGLLARDEVVQRAREERDDAVRRRNEAEMDLARSRVDMMQLNSQLMEAIQQKLGLSQQLEQWETDMQQILAEQVQQKLLEEQNGARLGTSTSDLSQSWKTRLLANLTTRSHTHPTP